MATAMIAAANAAKQTTVNSSADPLGNFIAEPRNMLRMFRMLNPMAIHHQIFCLRNTAYAGRPELIPIHIAIGVDCLMLRTDHQRITHQIRPYETNAGGVQERPRNPATAIKMQRQNTVARTGRNN